MVAVEKVGASGSQVEGAVFARITGLTCGN